MQTQTCPFSCKVTQRTALDYTPLQNNDHIDSDAPDVVQGPVTSGQLLESQRLEAAAVQHTEQQEYAQALAVFGRAMALTGERASLYNNRAQTHRLMANDDGECLWG